MLVLVAVALLAAGCAAADKGSFTTAGAAGGFRPAGAGQMAGMSMGAGGASMAGMSRSVTPGSGAGAGSAPDAAREAAVSGAAGAIKPVPMQVLGTAYWQGMKITAEAMTAIPFVIFNGTREQLIQPPKNASFHLMIMLNDAHTDVPIPYASVWATITRAGKVVYDARQWPMISEYMGPHYGNDVALPGAGRYRLTLLISPPVSARHLEYEHVWLTPHRVSLSFRWRPAP